MVSIGMHGGSFGGKMIIGSKAFWENLMHVMDMVGTLKRDERKRIER